MRKPVLAKTSMDVSIEELSGRADHITLATWAADCAVRVLPYFEEQYPDDPRPRAAIEALRKWVQTGVFRMADVRKASLDAHAAARNAGEFTPARSAARAAGQAMATAHVARHALAAAIYAATAVRDVTSSPDADEEALRERQWQYQHLLELVES
jgi:hypothetical protein